jgi:uncharacterized protein (TIGR02452 family)
MNAALDHPAGASALLADLDQLPTKTTGTSLVFGHVTAETPLILESRLAENSVIFSDGREKDILECNFGTQAVIGIAERRACWWSENMKRDTRALMAEQTVAICDAGFYDAPCGKRVSILDLLANAKAGTALYSVEKPPVARSSGAKCTTRIEVRNETTFQALERITAAGGGHLACLNFASAKNPGGGFLNGSLAQEEALACASGLYPCLLQAPEYYERNRANRSALYLDLAIYSPLVPFFRNDAGALIEKPILASVITAPAPNAGAIAQNEPANLNRVEPTMRRRAELVMEIAKAHQVDQLVLGAWGCGVFRNDPHIVARIFADLLKPAGKFAGVFNEVVFAVFDRSENEATYQAFADQLKGSAS